jgi:hypothetical protein
MGGFYTIWRDAMSLFLERGVANGFAADSKVFAQHPVKGQILLESLETFDSVFGTR